MLHAAFVAAVALWPGGAARAHDAPSTDHSHRYLKLAVTPARVRLAYTVAFGHAAAAAQRRAMDRDRDGAVSSAEQSERARALGQEVAERLRLRVDDVDVPVVFSMRSVGDAGAAGALSVDLVATACVPARRAHRVELRDAFVVPHAGHTELRVDAAPGVEIVSASVGGLRASEGLFRLPGAARALADPGLALAVAFAEELLATPCELPRAPSPQRASRGWPWAVAAVVVLGGILAAWWRARRHKTAEAR